MGAGSPMGQQVRGKAPQAAAGMATAAESVWERPRWAESQRPVAGASMQQRLMLENTEANIKGRTKHSHIKQRRPVAEASMGQRESVLQVRDRAVEASGRGLCEDICELIL
uniref:Uncharacterized protein n=1 Tax=Sphaerodactylus townsendi TaxID=933632 RepID=A0ACB8F482_9SAUR